MPPNGKRPELRSVKRQFGISDIVQTDHNGFPPQILESFEEYTSMGLKKIVMCRVPGPMARDLIIEGYDTKGFQIKAKSCDWGPMAGFLCHHPLFNKYGYDKAGKNLGEHIIYYKESKKRQDFPYRPISISNKRREDLASGIYYEGNKRMCKIDMRLIDETNRIYYGWSFSSSRDKSLKWKDKTIAVEYVLVKDKNASQFRLYYDLVLIYENDSWTEFNEDKFLDSLDLESKEDARTVLSLDRNLPAFGNPTNWKNFHEDDLVISIEASSNTDIKSYLTQSDLLAPFLSFVQERENRNRKVEHHNLITFRAMWGTCNPSSDPNNRGAKEIVTGDYDLFALVPLTEVDKKGYQRLADLRYNFPNTKVKLAFRERYSKPLAFAFEGVSNISLWIEIIPHYNEIKGLESENEGNYNSLVESAWNDLNKYIAQKTNDGSHKRVHHSDEGGRPSVKLIDLPIACFHPPKFLFAFDEDFIRRGTDQFVNVKYIYTPFQFIDYLIELRKSLEHHQEAKKKSTKADYADPIPLPINYGWFVHMYALTMSESEWQSQDLKNLSLDKKIVDKYKNELKESLFPKWYSDQTKKDVLQKMENEEHLITLRDKVVQALFFDIYSLDRTEKEYTYRMALIRKTFLVLFLYALSPKMSAIEARLRLEQVWQSDYKGNKIKDE